MLNYHYFDLIVFGPPHIIQNSDKGFMIERYGMFKPNEWKESIKKGFSELYRVLKPNGILILKWCETNKYAHSIPISEIIKLSSYKPIFGTPINKKSSITSWVIIFIISIVSKSYY